MMFTHAKPHPSDDQQQQQQQQQHRQHQLVMVPDCCLLQAKYNLTRGSWKGLRGGTLVAGSLGLGFEEEEPWFEYGGRNFEHAW